MLSLNSPQLFVYFGFPTALRREKSFQVIFSAIQTREFNSQVQLGGATWVLWYWGSPVPYPVVIGGLKGAGDWVWKLSHARHSSISLNYHPGSNLMQWFKNNMCVSSVLQISAFKWAWLLLAIQFICGCLQTKVVLVLIYSIYKWNYLWLEM